jgi:predicted transcriptional regulator
MLSLRKVLDALAAASAPLTVPEIAQAVSLSQVQVRRAVRKLRQDELVCWGDPVRRDRCGRCHYQYVPCAVYAQDAAVRG